MPALVRIVGSGLTAAAAAYRLRQVGVRVELLDAAPVAGGQLRTEAVHGVLYEPHGAHIFHTRDAEVWALVSRLVPFRNFRHRVLTEVGQRLLSWPPQIGELQELAEWPTIRDELARRPAGCRSDNFETWVVDLVGPTLYEWFIEPYTRKQWGVEPNTLAASWAPKRIELRDDGYTDLFRDPYQGWPVGGYVPLVDALLAGCSLSLGRRIVATNMTDVMSGAAATLVTAPLDEFLGCELGPLAWRGVRLVHHFHPDVDRVLAAPVVNHPGMDQAYTRRIETKWMSDQQIGGTVVSEEYPGADARHYPVDDAAGVNRALARAYQALLSERFGPTVHSAGRLASYTYIDMDQSIRQGLNAATRILAGL
jgi:UDP-galactopyranose mutase